MPRRLTKALQIGVGLLAAALAEVTTAGAPLAQTAAAPSVTPVAIAQPGINLGDTSFLDAGGTLGWTLELLASASTANHSNDGTGQRLPGRHGQDAGVLNVHPLYTTDIHLLGGYLGFDVLVPTVAAAANVPGAADKVVAGGVGDVATGTYLQWSDLQFAGRPLSLRAAISLTSPTGGYSRDRLINIGNNLWQVTPYVTATWQPTDAWELSARVTYNWSSVNNAPNTGASTRSAQPGDQIGINLATSYAVSPQWRMGVSGFAYQQLSDTRGDGLAVPGSKQRLFGVGPGVLWNAGANSVVVANVYREFGAENHSEGVSMRLRLLQSF